ncbi:MAG: carotenoid oxygenase family protein [Nannocystaceae bacterium]
MNDRAVPRDHRAGLFDVHVVPRDPEALEIEGVIPAELRGTLYRAGPGNVQKHGDPYHHWFDGDGLIQAIRLGPEGATHRLRFVEHSARIEEARAHRRLYGGFGTPPPGGRLRRFFRRRRRRNPANTHVIGHRGGLYALCEAGRPYRLDPETLTTIGEEDLGGVLPDERTTFAAHPRRDPTTGELWGFGVAPGRQTLLHLYRWPAEGRPERFTSVPLPLIPMIHDFAITASSIVVIVAPVCLPQPPLALIFGQRAYGECLRYRPELGGRILVIDRKTGATRWFECDPFVYFHVANAHDEGDDAIVVDVLAYDDDAVLDAFFAVYQGPFPRPVGNAVDRLRVDRRSGAVTRTRICAGFFELPRVADAVTGRTHRTIYALGGDDPRLLPRSPTKIDVTTGAIQQAPLAAHEWAGELVPVARPGARDDDDAWLLSVILDARARSSELRIYDAADLHAPPVARIRTQRPIPFGFHGSWIPG